MSRHDRRVRSLRRILCGGVAAALLLGPTMSSGHALGYAAGGFVPLGHPASYTGDGTLQAAAAGDVNHDGNSDVVIAGNDMPLQVMLMQPGGSLVPAGTTEPLVNLGEPVAAAIGNFNGDSDPDVLVVGDGDSTTGHTEIELFVGHGDGSFTATTPQDPGMPFDDTSRPGVAVGDLNGDGLLDLVLEHQTDGQFDVLINDGDGQFSTAGTAGLPSARGTVAIGVGDFNGDGRPDLAMLSECSRVCRQGTVSVFLNEPGALPGMVAFQPAPGSPFGTVIPYPVAITIGDINGDGRADVVASEESWNPGYTSVMLSRADGSLSAAPGLRITTPDGGNPAVGFDRRLGQAFVAVSDPWTNRLYVSLASPSGRLSPAPGSPYRVPGEPGTGELLPLVGQVDNDPYIALESQSATGEQLNVMADALRPSATLVPQTLGHPGAFASFNLPGAGRNKIRELERRAVRGAARIASIDGGPPEVRANFYHITDVGLAHDLVNAAQAGASVKVLLDGSNRSLTCGSKPGCFNPAYWILKELNSLDQPGTWMKTCDGLGPANPTTHPGRGNGCIGQTRDHNKFLMVSEAKGLWAGGGRVFDAVVQTSMNNTAASYRTALNNSLTTINQAAVYDDYVSYFDRLAASYAARTQPSVRRFTARYGFRADTTTLATHDIATWSFPTVPRDDPVLGALNNVRAAGRCANNTARSAGAPWNGVAVAMLRINGRLPVVRRLAALRKSGCNVQVAYSGMGIRDRKILTQANVGLHRICVAQRGSLGKPIAYVHSKYILVAGTAAGLGANRRIVYTGSENIANSALVNADDRMERYVEPAGHAPVFAAYFNNFKELLAISKLSPQSTTDCGAGDT